MPAGSEQRESLGQGLRQLLQERDSSPVELIETHLSWAILSRRTALKLYKPVRLPFVEHDSLAVRTRDLGEERRLNKRLAPGLYRALLQVRGTAAHPRFGGTGPVIDVALCMRRFDAQQLLSERLRTGTLKPEEIDALARRIALFHQEAATAPADGYYGSPPCVEKAIRLVFGQLAGDDEADAAGRWIESRMSDLRAEWRRRLANGYVRECHGDLHLDNTILWRGEATAFDCIGFDPALRWIDVMNDIAFMTMDLRARGRTDLAWRFLDVYLQATGDFAGLSVMAPYEVMRALVRAVVARLSPVGPSPVNYLACATSLVSAAARRPRLAIMHGLSGSGKSYVSAGLLQAHGAVRIRSDVERRRLHPISEGRYDESSTRRLQARLLWAARSALQSGFDVIVDATFLRREQRQVFRSLAHDLNVPFVIIACEAPFEVLSRRVVERSRNGADASEATLEVLQAQQSALEPLDSDERDVSLVVETAAAFDAAALSRRWSGAHL